MDLLVVFELKYTSRNKYIVNMELHIFIDKLHNQE